MIVLIDVDGVVADLVSAWLCALRGVDGYADRKFTPDDVHEWDIGKALGLPRATADLAWDALRRPCAHADIQPYPGARAAVEAIRGVGTGAEVYFVTQPLSRAPTWCYERGVWLQEHFGYSPAVYTRYKHLIDGDVLVDDSPEQLAAWYKARCDRDQAARYLARAVLIDRPWNRGQTPPGVTRASSLAVVAEWIASQAGARRPAAEMLP